MSENENDFETLRRLLALKRHEVPPPGYFENFSSQVIARIQAGETGSESVSGVSWLLRLLQAFETRPAYPVAFASGLCMLLLFGIVSVEQNPEMGSAWPTPNGSYVADVSGLAPNASQQFGNISNTNPPVGLPASSSLFDNNPPANPYFQQVSLENAN